MKHSKTLISTVAVAIVAILSLGFVYPQEAPVFEYSHLLTGFYVLVAAGLAGVGLVDLNNERNGHK